MDVVKSGSALAGWTLQRREEASRRLTAQWRDPEFRARAAMRVKAVDVRQAIASTVAAVWAADPKRREHTSAAVRANPPAATLRARGLSSERQKAKWKEPTYRAKMLEALDRGRKNGGRYEYLDRKGRLWKFKSGDRHERGFARWLDEQGLDWRYEPDRILLSDGQIYVPDFWVQEWRTYVEIKGYPRRLDKVLLAQQDGYSVRLVRNFREEVARTRWA